MEQDFHNKISTSFLKHIKYPLQRTLQRWWCSSNDDSGAM